MDLKLNMCGTFYLKESLSSSLAWIAVTPLSKYSVVKCNIIKSSSKYEKYSFSFSLYKTI